jgi:hypothetical protein
LTKQKLKTVLEEFQDSLSEFLPNKELTELMNFSNHFPSAHRGAFEFKLNDEDGFDFHLNFKNSDDLSGLINFLSKPKFKNNKCIQKVLLFIEKWDENQYGFLDYIPGIFLEYDYSNEEFNVPNLFIKIDFKKLSPKESFVLLKHICLTIKDESFFETYKSQFEKYTENDLDYKLGYIGFMLPRDEHLLRLNFHNVDCTNVNGFLEDVTGSSNHSFFKYWFDEVVDITDNTIISLDFYNGLPLDKIGFELFFENQPKDEPRWEYLLKKMSVSEDWKRLILNEWAGKSASTDNDKFPKMLLKNRGGKQFIPVCLKQLCSHLKLTINKKEILERKVYLGLGAVTPSNYSIKKKVVSNNSTFEKGLSFLLSAQQQSGFWRDFQIFKGFSDQWTTAYIANLLTELPQSEDVKKAINKAWGALKRTFRPEKGWGYNYYTPVDGDSTSWALLLASKVDKSFFEEHKDVINRFIIPGKGITTYVDKKEIMEYINLKEGDSFLGWNSAHNCITGVTNQIPGIDFSFILNSRMKEGGCWKGYWWEHDVYATYQCLKSLGTVNLESTLDSEEITSNFYLSLSIELISNIQGGHLDSSLQRLINEQLESGGWLGDAKIIVPMPNEVEYNSESNWERLDVKGLFTTATILRMLSKFN